MLDEAYKDMIVQMYSDGLTMENIGLKFNRSRRTVGRVLQERGVTHPKPVVTDGDMAILQVVKRRGLSFSQLLTVLRKYDKGGL